MNNISDKIYRKVHHKFFEAIDYSSKYNWLLYPSYRYYKRHKKIKTQKLDYSNIYITQEPNRGAGIGHQLGNWLAGFCVAKRLGVNYAYSKFPDVSMGENDSWDRFLGFGESIIHTEELLKQGYIKRKLPYFNLDNPQSREIIEGIVNAYAANNKKVIFYLELDFVYTNLQEALPEIKNYFNNASARKNDRLVFDKNKLNIAVHVRRGDIAGMGKRWLDNNYYARVLRETLQKYAKDRPYEIYLFSQGKKEDFPEFADFENLNFCFDMSAKNSFLHMIRADIIITSKSSFSYKPALLSDGIKIVPKDFWHGYPDSEDWILVEEE